MSLRTAFPRGIAPPLLALGLLVAALLPGRPLAADPPVEPLDGREGRDLALDQFRPHSMLQVPEHVVPHPRFPVVDVHLHPRIKLHSNPQLIDEYVGLMDDQHIAVSVSLDGRMGDELDEHLALLWGKHRDRFVVFANVDWRGSGAADDPATWACQQPGFADRVVKLLAESKQKGVSGLKVFKDLGLVYRNPDGSLIRVNDPRWDPIWQACGTLGLPVLIHVGDPAAFFQPIDATNERWEELRRHPEWSFAGPGFPTYKESLEQLIAIVRRHPQTMFIAPHLANSAEDLGQLSRWLEQYPNLNVDLAARIGELGRQPRTARNFFIKYADRILFGTDGPRARERLLLHWRLMETDDEYFPYADSPVPPQGFWRIYGLDLPEDVLRKIYYENACRLIPGVKEKYQAYERQQAQQGSAP